MCYLVFEKMDKSHLVILQQLTTIKVPVHSYECRIDDLGTKDVRSLKCLIDHYDYETISLIIRPRMVLNW